MGQDGVPRDAKAITEYFVIQKTLRSGKEGPWTVWGTTEESSVEAVRKERAGKRRRKRGLREVVVGQS